MLAKVVLDTVQAEKAELQLADLGQRLLPPDGIPQDVLLDNLGHRVGQDVHAPQKIQNY